MRRQWPYLAHLPVVAWLFGPSLFLGRLPYFRDVSVYYYPQWVFLERSLRQGVWPLWNPTGDAGVPFLATDPLDLLLVASLGAEGALRLAGALHLLLAMCGATLLARVLGLGLTGAWAAGLFHGASGYVLSTANLFELHHATAWGPLVVAAAVTAWRRPAPRTVAGLALAGAAQVATLGAETVLQTALAAVALVREKPAARRLLAAAGAALLALLLAAPALLGARALVGGSRREAGFAPGEAYAWSVRPAVLLDAALPRFFGDVHAFSDVGYWGQPFFTGGYPYLLSLYLGPGLLLLAARSGPWPPRRRLWALAALGVLLAMGIHGPLATVLGPLLRHFRCPAKFLFLPNLALCLLAARGLERARGEARPPTRLLLLLPLALLASSLAVASAPALPGRALGRLLPELLDPRALLVAATQWPAAFATAGALFLGVVLALASRRLAPLAGVLVGLDLLVANGAVNPTAERAFYSLHPDVARLVAGARGEGDGLGRWLSYGVMGTPGLRFSPAVVRANRDVWLYYADRQALLPRTNVLDGLDSAFDEDRVGWAPPGSTLSAEERVPERFPQHHRRLLLAGVRHVLSFRELPESLVRERGRADLPWLLEPLRLSELRGALPRAFLVGSHEVVAGGEALARRLEAPDFDPASTVLLAADPGPLPAPRGEDPAPPGTVAYERLDPHTVRLAVDGPAGLVVVTDGYHRDWRVAEEDGAEVPLLRANGRYWAIPTPGGRRVYLARFQPAWRTPALVACAVGLLAALLLAVRGGWKGEASPA